MFTVVGAPVFAYGVTVGDLVRASSAPDDDRLWLAAVVSHSDRWLARVIPKTGSGVSQENVVERFEPLGCVGRITSFGLVTLDVTGDVPADLVISLLERGQDVEGTWYFDLGVKPS